MKMNDPLGGSEAVAASDWVRCEDCLYRGSRNFELVIPDLALRRGVTTAVIGGNGSGKTTLMRLLMGLLRPDSGRVALFGRSASRPDIDTRRRIGVQWQGQGIGRAYQVSQVIAVHRAVYGSLDSEVFAAFNIDELADKRVGRLSSGEMQRVLIALAFAHRPEAVLLDEPTSNLDARYEAAFSALLAASCDRVPGFSAYVITHARQVLDSCSEVLMMRRGRVEAQGAAATIVPAMFGARALRLEGPAELLESLAPRIEAEPSVTQLLHRSGALVAYGEAELDADLPSIAPERDWLSVATWQTSTADLLERIKHDDES